ncbi:MAG: hypothetical protein MAG551_01992 [Candidatus Scalindua arabica]|uniref:Glycosyltransferase 2-like domain-containing protein n=1 Tax=Candidatus Scalindua arabica TaxID=1127984 RepID=A0A942A159_9BACT|nr:hypothetical protein [Candidatus Scalindua arabica]
MEWLINNIFSYLDWSVYEVHRMDLWALLGVYASFLMIDGPRYILTKIIMLFHDVAVELGGKLDCEKQEALAYQPRVSIICPGKDEREHITGTIESLLAQDYPDFEIIVIDDGSSDDTWGVLEPYIEHPQVKLFRRQIAGGKSSAANMGLKLADPKSEVIVIVDSDSSYHKNAISEIIAPFKDPKVGGVSGNIRAKNWDENLITRFQAADYLHSVSLGRRFTSWAGTLAICSGAFGAFRKSLVEAVGGWDVGPGEDGDLTIKMRKIGYDIRFAPHATCFTDVPNSWRGWWKQRRRWNRGLIRYKMRKHFDMAIPGSDSYSFTNMLVILDVFFLRIFLNYSFFFYFTTAILFAPAYSPLILSLTFMGYFFSNCLQMAIQLYYSEEPLEDLKILSASLIMYPYRLGQRIIRLISVTEEIFARRSYRDPYVPSRVGEATIHW